MEHRSLLAPLGYRHLDDYYIFKDHLRMPLPYLKIIVKNYRSLSRVPVVLHEIVNRYHEHLWSNMVMERQEILIKLAGVPPLFCEDEELPDAPGETLRLFRQITGYMQPFVKKARLLYLHSDFETNALRAASQIIKAGIKAKISSYMIDFPNVMKEIKTWTESEALQKLDEAQIACIYMIGKEYATEFSAANLETIIASRTVANKVTILCSHLTPDDFLKRYNTPVRGTIMRFNDPKIKATIAELMADLGA